MEERVYEQYKKLGIPEKEWPRFENPHDFAKNIKKCSITVDVPITTSDSTYKARFNTP